MFIQLPLNKQIDNIEPAILYIRSNTMGFAWGKMGFTRNQNHDVICGRSFTEDRKRQGIFHILSNSMWFYWDNRFDNSWCNHISSKMCRYHILWQWALQARQCKKLKQSRWQISSISLSLFHSFYLEEQWSQQSGLKKLRSIWLPFHSDDQVIRDLCKVKTLTVITLTNNIKPDTF